MEAAVCDATASVTFIAARYRTPFAVFVSTVVSLRTRDEVTFAVSQRVLSEYPDIKALAGADAGDLAELLKPAAFYHNKSVSLIDAARQILGRHAGEIPTQIEDLLALPGVGRKTAQLVRAEGHGLPAICVDIHVHRISNRLGLCDTRKPEETEKILAACFQEQDWIRVNRVMVPFGQKVCAPVSPWCSRCPLQAECPRIGVARNR